MMKLLKSEAIVASLHGLGVVLLFSGLYSLFFLPELLGEKFLAPADGFLQSLPAFFSPRQLWTPFLWGGFPIAADVTPQTWYPVSLLFALFKSWNGFVISAYALASSFSYGYVFRLTKSSPAACFSGIAYGMSGFMMAHLGHTSMIHSAAWIPLMIWAIEELRWGMKYRWILAGTIAVACCFLGGHPQIFVYGMGLTLALAFVRGMSLGKACFAYWLRLALIIGFGILLTGIQLIPTLELSSLTPRASLSFQTFLEYSVPLTHLPLLLFPYAFGSYGGGPYGEAYWGAWNLTELTSYVGLLPLLLSALCLAQSLKPNLRSQRLDSFFWAAVALVSLLLMVGDATPLAKLSFYLPGFNKFRALARYSILLALATSVLSGLAIANLQRQVYSLPNSKRVLKMGMLSFLLLAIFAYKLQRSLYVEALGPSRPLELWLSLTTIGVPVLVMGCGLSVLYSALSRPRLGAASLLLFLVLVLDLGSFGWFYNRSQMPSQALASPSQLISRYQSILSTEKQKLVLPQGSNVSLGIATDVGQAIPNVSMLWKLNSVSGYGPLLLERISQLFSMPAHGILPPSWHEDLADQSLNLAAVQYAFLSKHEPSIKKLDIRWGENDLGLSLGQACAPVDDKAFEFEIASMPARVSSPTVTASDIAVVSALACSGGVRQGAVLLEVSVLGRDGTIEQQVLKAGRDTAEWAYDCDDVRPHMQHQKAEIFSSFITERGEANGSCLAHRYLTRLRLATPIEEVASVQVRWLGQAGTIILHKLSLIDGESGDAYPLRRSMVDNPRWKLVEVTDDTQVYRNGEALPRAFLVPTVKTLAPAEILTAIQESRLPGDRRFDPRQVALLEAPLGQEWEPLMEQPQPVAATPLSLPQPQLTDLSTAHVQIQTNADTSSFLVLADTDYPGWQATLDGQPVNIFRTNYAFRGLPVPPGAHQIEFKFRPRSFNLGLGMTSAAAALLGGVLFRNNAQW